MEFLLEIDKINILCSKNTQLLEIARNVKRKIPNKKISKKNN